MAEPLCCSAETLLIGYTAGQNKKLKKKKQKTKKAKLSASYISFQNQFNI